MYTATALLVLAATSASATIFAERAPVALAGRSVQQGWSVQSDSAPAGTTSCGGGAYCPSSLSCHTPKNDEVAACCPSSDGNCVGAVEGAPACADSSWNMFIGNDGNGFCCEVGLVGVVNSQAKTVGCVSSGSVGSQTTALLTMSGDGAAATSGSSASSASSASTTSSSSASETTMTSSSTTVIVSTSGSSTISSTSVVAITSTMPSMTTSSSSGSGSSSSASASTAAAEKTQLAMGLMAAGFMVAAAL